MPAQPSPDSDRRPSDPAEGLSREPCPLPDASRLEQPFEAVAVGPVRVGPGEPLAIIAGPCVLEATASAIEIALRLREACERQGFQLIFKASFDKANRTSLSSARGPGIQAGVEMLEAVSREAEVPVTTDVHLPEQAERAAEVCQLLQVPAFLARQTDLLVAAAETQRAINVKKGQFMAPRDMRFVIDKLVASGAAGVLLCERGTFFGYGRLVNDLTGLPQMRGLGVPVVFDATHSVQQPSGSDGKTGGNRAMVPPLARAAVAVGVDAVFLETHPTPEHSPSDGPNMVPLGAIDSLFAQLAAVRRAVAESEGS
jgi:2-dehydro-3-deoxyphosphooctonate aldolase (KDO 8-P synthase)